MTGNRTQGRLRAEFGEEVLVDVEGGRQIKGHTENISLNGVFVVSEQKPAQDSLCQVQITLNRMSPPLVIKIKAKVVRVADTGFAVHFVEMDVNTLEHLQKIVIYNSEKPEEVLKQNKNRPGFK